MAFLERILRALTPCNQRDWLAQHPNARVLKSESIAGGWQYTYADSDGTAATYSTDPLGNVLKVTMQ